MPEIVSPTLHIGPLVATTGTFSGAVSMTALTATTGNFSGTLVVAGVATFVDGSAAAPGFRVTGAASGFFKGTGTDDLGVSVGGVERVRFVAAGQLLVGTTAVGTTGVGGIRAVGASLFDSTVAVTSTLSAGAGTHPIQLGRLTDDTPQGAVSFNGALTSDGSLGLWGSAASNILVMHAPTGKSLAFRIANTNALRVSALRSVIAGADALATTATDGFFYVPTCAGIPTGVPTVFGDTKAMQYDSTNNRLYVYNGAWRSALFA